MAPQERSNNRHMDQPPSLSAREYSEVTSHATCEVCRSGPAVFCYEIFSGGETGRCCLSCFANLIRTMFGGNTGSSFDGQTLKSPCRPSVVSSLSCDIKSWSKE
jgi:hypothetical protein